MHCGGDVENLFATEQSAWRVLDSAVVGWPLPAAVVARTASLPSSIAFACTARLVVLMTSLPTWGSIQV
jgi:hypothetical protein